MAQFTTVRRYRDLSEAIVARSLLESCGIEVNLCDENLARLDWQISNFIGGIRLQVKPDDEQVATQILDSPVPEFIEYQGDAPSFMQPICPRCGSIDISFEGSSRKAALASLYLISMPLPLGAKSWLCSRCKNRWSDLEEELP